MFTELNHDQIITLTAPINVLFVEDNINTQKGTVKLLNLFFKNIHVCSNGIEALELLKNNKIDLLITDINMPLMNGIELIEEISKQNYDVQKIILSAYSNQEYIFKAILLGIDGFILKPLNHEQFLNTIKKVVKNILSKKENEKNIHLLKQYQEITNKSSIISKTDANGIITYVNDKFCSISGYTKEELIGQSHNIVRHPDTKKEVFSNLWNIIKIKKESWQGIIKNLSKDGKTYYVKSTVKPILDQDGNILEFMALRNDISAVMSDKKQLLAALENRNESFLAIIQIDNFDILDKFYNSKTIDEIESKFSETILSLLPKDSVFMKIYRLGDGRFALREDLDNIKKNNINIKEDLEKLILAAKHASIRFKNIEYDASIVVSYCYGKDNLFENAKYGLEKAIKSHLNLILANNLIDESQKIAQKNIETIRMVKKALDNKKIISYFQPIIDNKTKEIIKYESLVRLINEKEEIISPYAFLDISKKGTYYTKITKRVIESTFNVLDHIKHNVSINLSILDIENIEIREILLDLVAVPKYNNRVTFELLEDENIKDFQTVKDFIQEAKRIGNVQIAIDDFGSGYSNFERLLDYSPDILKIDGSLIKNIETNKFSRNIVETIVTFAKKQNIKTVAEYVENENIYNILTKMGIDYSQGYYFGKPEKLI